jgi:hypothetical protein
MFSSAGTPRFELTLRGSNLVAVPRTSLRADATKSMCLASSPCSSAKSNSGCDVRRHGQTTVELHGQLSGEARVQSEAR